MKNAGRVFEVKGTVGPLKQYVWVKSSKYLCGMSGVGEELESGNEDEMTCRRNHISGILCPGPRCILRHQVQTLKASLQPDALLSLLALEHKVSLPVTLCLLRQKAAPQAKYQTLALSWDSHPPNYTDPS